MDLNSCYSSEASNFDMAVECQQHFCTPMFYSAVAEILCKGHPGTAHEGPEGEQMYGATLSLTSALNGGGCSTPRPGCFTHGKDPVPIG